ncbi:hypothetical protein ACUXZZ_23850 [Streptomyces graminifolii]|uniref:hypothetical protein n=1 Tax=Streptomyces graminifolii TaxID=1266771 RepID=UPI004057E4D0
MKVLGVAVSAGAIHYGALTADEGTQDISHPPGAPERLVPALGLTGAQRLGDTHQRIAQEIRVLQPDAVIIVATRRKNQWVYREAFDRISLISALMLSCVEQGVTCEEWSTERIGKLVGVPAPKLASFDCKEAGFAQLPLYWAAGRVQAFAAAKAYVVEMSSESSEG